MGPQSWPGPPQLGGLGGGCYVSVHGKKMVCVRGVPGVTGTLGKANSHFDPTQTGRGPYHHVEAAVDWCSSILLALHVHIIYTTEISHFTIQKDRSQYVFWGRTESR